jgi:hypothetical protein
MTLAAKLPVTARRVRASDMSAALRSSACEMAARQREFSIFRR